MNEWPTRVRTGRPPCSATISGTAREVIRLWITVAPGCRASSRTATSAVTADGDDRVAVLVDDEAAVGVAVEGQPDVGTLVAHPRLQVDQVGRVERVRLVVGEGAVELEVHRHQRRRGSPARTVGTVCPAIPLPASTTTFSRRWRGQVDEVAQVLGVRRRGRPAASPVRGGRPLSGSGTPCWARSRISVRPLSWPIGRGAGAAELDAVVLGRVVAGREHRAGQVEAAAGEVELVGRGEADLDDVGALLGDALGEGRDELGRGRPHVVTDRRCRRRPHRRPGRTRRPSARTTSASSWSGTMPRTSYALTNVARSWRSAAGTAASLPAAHR